MKNKNMFLSCLLAAAPLVRSTAQETEVINFPELEKPKKEWRLSQVGISPFNVGIQSGTTAQYSNGNRILQKPIFLYDAAVKLKFKHDKHRMRTHIGAIAGFSAGSQAMKMPSVSVPNSEMQALYSEENWFCGLSAGGELSFGMVSVGLDAVAAYLETYYSTGTLVRYFDPESGRRKEIARDASRDFEKRGRGGYFRASLDFLARFGDFDKFDMGMKISAGISGSTVSQTASPTIMIGLYSNIRTK
jgi:hypothetical protein